MTTPDPLDPLLAVLREAPLPPASARVALGLEARVLSRICRENTPSITWLRRWSPMLGAGTAACALLLVHNLLALSAASADAVFTGNWLLLGWF